MVFRVFFLVSPTPAVLKCQVCSGSFFGSDRVRQMVTMTSVPRRFHESMKTPAAEILDEKIIRKFQTEKKCKFFSSVSELKINILKRTYINIITKRRRRDFF